MASETYLARARCLAAALARVLGAELVETHISWVLLAGELAYKIKKPVRLPFVDYGTLAARRHFCEEELRLNHRLAPSIYLGITRITGTADVPAIEGAGPVLEYAVRMRRFAPGALFSERVAAGTLAREDVQELAGLLARYHSEPQQALPAGDFAGPGRRAAAAQAALAGARSQANEHEHAHLLGWLAAGASALEPLWRARQSDGHVRQCHGDLHLDNIVHLDGGVAAFDCIEFDPALSCIDVIDDIAFPVMDFAARGRRDFAFVLLNDWMDRTGDHAALPALRFSAVYRALVRAQVEHLRGAGRESAARRYLAHALAWTQPGRARLWITHGLPGSGKTWQSQRLLEREGAIRLRSDVERKRLYGLGMLDDSRARGVDLYSREATERTYAQLLAIARQVLQAGYPAILDAAFLRREERARAHALARELDVPYSIIACDAPMPVLRERLLARRGDASEADVQVLEKLNAAAEPLEADELSWLVPMGQ